MEARGLRADVVCKIVIIGDSGVGKTCVMRRFTDDEFSYNFVATVGIDFKIKMFRIKEKAVKVQIWDTAGQEKFYSITTAYYRGAKGIIIAYDITDRKSFEHVSKWITNVQRWAGTDIELLLLGNKCDLDNNRAVEKREGEKLAKQHNMYFSETSAKNNINVETSFMKLLDSIVDKVIMQQVDEEKVRNRSETVPIRPQSESSQQTRQCCNKS